MIDNLGEATSRREVPEASIDRYQSKLPGALMGYWREEGWCSYADGLFWIVDPDPYKATLDRWLHGSGLVEIDNYHVIARDAFGSLYAWGERYQRSITVSSLAGGIVALKSQLQQRQKNPDLALSIFFATATKDDFDFEDRMGNPLFERALAKLGPLSESEMYAFEPALSLGGRADLDGLVKVDMDVHLTLLDQFRR
ncbi:MULTISPECIES: GAD-like domain-containing protein [unclassified Pseudomonas]|uniref:GAD-like domain-containing protein n=1 Tax=unclassified Pseudomonas TaxID=196821 RepID=UPI001903D9CC|nr:MULTISPECIES: GAD-like domain-containing protein [unclassified Pseudomonas]